MLGIDRRSVMLRQKQREGAEVGVRKMGGKLKGVGREEER